MNDQTVNQTAAIILVVACLFGAVSLESGTEAEYWDTNSVVYAKVVNVASEGNGSYRVTLTPLATLTGRFDCATFEEISAQAYIGEATSIRARPEPASHVLVVIHQKNGAYSIPSSYCKFMPNKSSLSVVTDFGDDAVIDTITSLKQLRAEKSQPVPAY